MISNHNSIFLCLNHWKNLKYHNINFNKWKEKLLNKKIMKQRSKKKVIHIINLNHI